MTRNNEIRNAVVNERSISEERAFTRGVRWADENPSLELVATFMKLVRTQKISAWTTNELAAELLRKELTQ